MKCRLNMPWPCGQCIACRLNYARNWSIRLMDEARCWQDTSFLTLTYDDDHLPADGSIHKEEVQKFMKRLRKSLGGKEIKYFACGEYGEKYGRPHYHVALFGVGVDSPVYDVEYIQKDKIWRGTMDTWKNGLIGVGDLTVDSANYVAGYMVKKVKGKGAEHHYKQLGIEPEFALMSRRPAIGLRYALKNSDVYRENEFVLIKGHKYPLPRYYRQKLFTDDERDSLKLRRFYEDLDEKILRFDDGRWRYKDDAFEVRPVTAKEKLEQERLNFEAQRETTRRFLNDG